ncbi:hypothetical protein Nepgr_005272 [Nepenthes gracilis]|uniref:Uncharacterized protein n=1 Tax=Nepenthes gracilis TaxID=150966 RepID=A0AAD3XG85_NEPGR|nr:hypothetical protein Nepgr_005272 [Nepenthes gracilis]
MVCSVAPRMCYYGLCTVVMFDGALPGGAPRGSFFGLCSLPVPFSLLFYFVRHSAFPWMVELVRFPRLMFAMKDRLLGSLVCCDPRLGDLVVRWGCLSLFLVFVSESLECFLVHFEAVVGLCAPQPVNGFFFCIQLPVPQILLGLWWPDLEYTVVMALPWPGQVMPHWYLVSIVWAMLIGVTCRCPTTMKDCTRRLDACSR